MRPNFFSLAYDANCNTLIAVTSDFGFGHLGGHSSLAKWTGLRVMPAAPISLFAEYIRSALVL